MVVQAYKDTVNDADFINKLLVFTDYNEFKTNIFAIDRNENFDDYNMKAFTDEESVINIIFEKVVD